VCTLGEIVSLDIDVLRANFFVLMGDVVTAYGDDCQVSLPLVCPGQSEHQVSLPGSDGLSIHCSEERRQS
jgi:hypothetical protein